MAAASSARSRVGVRDVAREAGVSTQTVSRVLNDQPHIRPETRERVLAAVAALGYRMNNAARALGTSRSRTIGVVVSDAQLFGPAAGVAALEAEARSRGLWITAAHVHDGVASGFDDAARHLLDQGVDGLVVVAPQLPAAALAEAVEVPVVGLSSGIAGERQSRGAALAVAHLADIGHTRIAELRGPATWLESAARTAGVAAAVDSRGVELRGTWSGDWSAASGDAVADAVATALDAADAPTAVAVANDQMALGLVAGLRRHGIRVPDDISVTGFDDHPDSAFYAPPLTTVRLDLPGEAARCLGEILGDPAPHQPAEPTLVVRRSTAPPAH